MAFHRRSKLMESEIKKDKVQGWTLQNDSVLEGLSVLRGQYIVTFVGRGSNSNTIPFI